MEFIEKLAAEPRLLVTQEVELFEFMGAETRNKYRIQGGDGQLIAYAAGKGDGIFAQIFRNMFGHWRTFTISIFDAERSLALVATHPFRFLFKRIDVSGSDGSEIGSIERRFSIFGKKFDVVSADGIRMFSVNAPLWRIWTFDFVRRGKTVATIKKKWSGVGRELFTDADTFEVAMPTTGLRGSEKAMLLVAALYIDLVYFETNANNRRPG